MSARSTAGSELELVAMVFRTVHVQLFGSIQQLRLWSVRRLIAAERVHNQESSDKESTSRRKPLLESSAIPHKGPLRVL